MRGRPLPAGMTRHLPAMSHDAPASGPTAPAPWLGRFIALALLALTVMVALGVWGVFRHAREQDRVTRESGGPVPAQKPVRP